MPVSTHPAILIESGRTPIIWNHYVHSTEYREQNRIQNTGQLSFTMSCLCMQRAVSCNVRVLQLHASTEGGTETCGREEGRKEGREGGRVEWKLNVGKRGRKREREREMEAGVLGPLGGES